MKFILGLLISCVIYCNNTFADDKSFESTPVINADLSESMLSSFVVKRSVTPVIFEDKYGKLQSESMVGQYTRTSLTKFLNHKVCAGLYWFNCNYNQDNIKQYIGTDLGDESSVINPSISAVNGYKITYTTIGMDNKEHLVSGAVLIPQTTRLLKGTVLFYHYTLLNKRNSPSNFDADETKLTKTLAATIAADGYVVLIPDYIGDGIDESSVHPYILYPQNNALSGIYMLKTVANLESNVNYKTINQKTPLFISGYSEGASYALWASKILQDNPKYLTSYGYNLTKTVPIAGAYNLSQVTFNFLLESSPLQEHVAPYFIEDHRVANFLRPALLMNALDSYVNFGVESGESYVFTSSLIESSPQNSDESFTIPALLQKTNLSEIGKYKAFYDKATAVGYDGKYNSSILPLINPEILNSQQFNDVLAAADIYNWKSNSAINFLTLEHDSVVTRLNSEVAYYAMSKQGSTALSITVVPNQNFKASGYIPFTDIDIDHGSAIPYMFLFARNAFNESLNNGKNN